MEQKQWFFYVFLVACVGMLVLDGTIKIFKDEKKLNCTTKKGRLPCALIHVMLKKTCKL